MSEGTRFRGVNEETIEPDGSEVRVWAETWGGQRLVRVDVGEFDLPQYHRHVYVTARKAHDLGESLIAWAEVGPSTPHAESWARILRGSSPLSAEEREKLAALICRLAGLPEDAGGARPSSPS